MRGRVGSKSKINSSIENSINSNSASDLFPVCGHDATRSISTSLQLVEMLVHPPIAGLPPALTLPVPGWKETL